VSIKLNLTVQFNTAVNCNALVYEQMNLV